MDAKAAFAFFSTDARLFGADCHVPNPLRGRRGNREGKTLRKYFYRFLQTLGSAFPARADAFNRIELEMRTGLARPHMTTIARTFFADVADGSVPLPSLETATTYWSRLRQAEKRSTGFDVGKLGLKKPSGNHARASTLRDPLAARIAQGGYEERARLARDTAIHVVNLKTAVNKAGRRRTRAARRKRQSERYGPPKAGDLADRARVEKALVDWILRSEQRRTFALPAVTTRAEQLIRRFRLTFFSSVAASIARKCMAHVLAYSQPLTDAAVVSYNINGAHNYIAALVAAASVLPHRAPDVFLLQETKPGKLQLPRVPGYVTFELPRLQGHETGGGVAVLVRAHIPASLVPNASRQSDGTGAEWLAVRLETLPPITVCTLYRPPHCTAASDLDSCRSLLDCLSAVAKHSTLIVAGDLNLLFGNYVLDANRQRSFQWEATLVKLGLRRVISQVYTDAQGSRTTRIDGSREVDHFFTPHKVAASAVAEDFGVSDHYALRATLADILRLEELKPEIAWNKAKRDVALMNAVTAEAHRLFATRQVDSAEGLLVAISDAARAVLGELPTVHMRAARRDVWKKEGWWHGGLTNLVNDVRRSHRRLAELYAQARARPAVPPAEQLRRAARLTAKRDELHVRSAALQRAMRETKQAHYNSIRADLNPRSGVDISYAHKVARSFMTGGRKPTISYGPDEMTAAWTPIFGPVLPSAVYDAQAKSLELEAALAPLRQAQPEYPLDFSEKEVAAAMMKLPLGKASGPDRVPNEFWRALGKKGPMHIFLARYMKELITDPVNRIEPYIQRATVVMIPKKDTPASPTDYRPISLVCTLYKLLEHMLFARIKPRLAAAPGNAQLRAMPHTLNSQITPLEQAGFSTNRSTTQQIFLMRLAREQAGRDGKQLYVTSYDQAKAFDSAQWLEIALAMARSKRWHWREVEFCLQWMRGHTRTILVNGKLTDEITVTRGVPQGGVLSPTLYNELVTGLMTEMDALGDSADANTATTRVTVNEALSISLLGYADDMDHVAYTLADSKRAFAHAALPWSARTASTFNLQKFNLFRFNPPAVLRRGSEQLQISAGVTITTTQTWKQLGAWHDATDANYLQPMTMVSIAKLSKNGVASTKEMPAIESQLSRQKACFSPNAGASPLLSVRVMRTRFEQSMLHTGGISQLEYTKIDQLLARICKGALGAAPTGINGKRACEFCGMPSALATALKLQLSLAFKSLLIRPVIAAELQRPWDAADEAGHTWRSLLVARMCSLHPDAPPAPASIAARNAWCVDLLATALVAAGAPQWQARVLDPLAPKLWPPAHPALLFAGHDAVFTWRLFSQRLVPIYTEAYLLCKDCANAGVAGVLLTPDHLLTCGRNIPVQLLLLTPAYSLRFFDGKASLRIEAEEYRSLVETAARTPKQLKVDVSAVHIPPLGQRALGDDLAEAQLYITRCVTLDATAIHAKIYALVEADIKEAHRARREAARLAAAGAGPGAGAPPPPPAPPGGGAGAPGPNAGAAGPPPPPAPAALAPPGGGGGAPGPGPGAARAPAPHAPPNPGENAGLANQQFNGGFADDEFDDDDDDDTTETSTRQGGEGPVGAGPASATGDAATIGSGRVYTLLPRVVNPGGFDRTALAGRGGRPDAEAPAAAIGKAALSAQLAVALEQAAVAPARSPERATRAAALGKWDAAKAPAETARTTAHLEDALSDDGDTDTDTEFVSAETSASDCDENHHHRTDERATPALKASDESSSSSSRRSGLALAAFHLEWSVAGTEPLMPSIPVSSSLRRSNRIAALAERSTGRPASRVPDAIVQENPKSVDEVRSSVAPKELSEVNCACFACSLFGVCCLLRNVTNT
jgi:exonuclease III